MVQLTQQHKVDDLVTSFVLPEGDYTAVINKSEEKENARRTGTYVDFTFNITTGQYAGTEVHAMLNFNNPSEDAVRIAYEQLGKICKALGMDQTPTDTSALHNKPLVITVKTKKGQPYQDRVTGQMKDGVDRSEIKGFKPLPKSGVSPTAMANQQNTQSQVTPATVQDDEIPF